MYKLLCDVNLILQKINSELAKDSKTSTFAAHSPGLYSQYLIYLSIFYKSTSQHILHSFSLFYSFQHNLLYLKSFIPQTAAVTLMLASLSIPFIKDSKTNAEASALLITKSILPTV